MSKAGALLGYVPTHTIAQGLDEALEWYVGALVDEKVSSDLATGD